MDQEAKRNGRSIRAVGMKKSKGVKAVCRREKA
jgi:hypothetical protein